MRGPIVAVSVEKLGPVEWLAVVGGGVVGGLLIGFLTGMIVRMVSTRKMPRWARNVVRLTGAVLSGWLMLALLGGGGLGFGGGGGGLFGSGTGKSEHTGTGSEGGGPGTPTSKQSPVVLPAENTLRVEVLGPDALKKLPAKPDVEHCYRVEDEDGQKLLTLKEVKAFILKRQKTEPPLRRVAIVLYKDSPDRKNPTFVKELKDWAEDLKTDTGAKMKVDFELPDQDAPTR